MYYNQTYFYTEMKDKKDTSIELFKNYERNYKI